ncbi:unnamed protein product [Didymodactylos carnosus]|uniref:Uncharacterized protein n=1 Tax=Didymodactylos carnosus TaxID=1234261 RepID=A0A813SE60_9BILA|nr:unnamed protein product [Didymodactylos carnosus]CAF3578293.1 unnamed protein product [Didymodactylos carnosus]
MNCGSGQCILTNNPTLPYYCRCLNGTNTIFPCPPENPCARNPCGSGTCDLVPSLAKGYLCRCAGFSATRSVCSSNPCYNGACVDNFGGFVCNCLPNWTGKMCDTAGGCNQISCMNGGTCYENSPGVSVFAYCLCQTGYTGKLCETEYFRCRSNGRFADGYNCAHGKYFECIQYLQAPNSNGILLSRSCPASLRYNFMIGRCDYAQNVQCLLA